MSRQEESLPLGDRDRISELAGRLDPPREGFLDLLESGFLGGPMRSEEVVTVANPFDESEIWEEIAQVLEADISIGATAENAPKSGVVRPGHDFLVPLSDFPRCSTVVDDQPP